MNNLTTARAAFVVATLEAIAKGEQHKCELPENVDTYFVVSWVCTECERTWRVYPGEDWKPQPTDDELIGFMEGGEPSV